MKVTIARLVRAYFYPPEPIRGVPHASATFEVKEKWLKSFYLSKPLFDDGKCGVSKQSADDLCDMYRVANRKYSWPDQFNPVCKKFANLRFAADLVKLCGFNIDHVLSMFKYGDQPAWLALPGDDMVFVQQQIPKTLDELDQIVGCLHKSFFGKRKDKRQSSILLGPCTSPLAMLHAPTFPILKSVDSDGTKVWQCIYDCSNDTRRIVVKKSDYSISSVPGLRPGSTRLRLSVKFPPSVDKVVTSTKPFNKLLITKRLYNAQTVDYSSLLGLRYYICTWPNGRVSWLDLSTGPDCIMMTHDSTFNHIKALQKFKI